jgi:hypothetical protein
MPAKPLTPVDLEFIQDLKDVSIIRKIKMVDKGLTNGFVFCTCGDCERFPDNYRYQKKLLRASDAVDFMPHMLALNGGPLLIPEDSPLNMSGESIVMKKQIADSLALKNLNVILLMLHAPCGAAQLTNMTLEETFRVYYKAVIYLREAHPSVEIITQCHLHKPDQFSTYSINIDRYAGTNLVKAAAA